MKPLSSVFFLLGVSRPTVFLWLCKKPNVLLEQCFPVARSRFSNSLLVSVCSAKSNIGFFPINEENNNNDISFSIESPIRRCAVV